MIHFHACSSSAMGSWALKGLQNTKIVQEVIIIVQNTYCASMD